MKANQEINNKKKWKWMTTAKIKEEEYRRKRRNER